jgi:2-oxoglutarate dehydrogenase E2 component (dihydrolipoamide succinyltransferase)
VPEVNSRFHEDGLEMLDEINMGIGTALSDEGLIVPVIHGVEKLNLEEIAQRIQVLADKARKSQLEPFDVSGGTFTISNHGVSGSLMAAPIIINQPQTAILGIGKLEKRVIVVEDGDEDRIEIRPMCYVTLTIDHRVLDAYQTNKYLAVFADTLENWPD